MKPTALLSWTLALLLAPGASAQAPLAGHVLVFNATGGKVRYQTGYRGERATATNVLDADDYHLFRKAKGLMCRYGTPPVEVALLPGSLYQLKADPESPGKLALVRLTV